MSGLLSEQEMSDKFGERLAVVETTVKHSESKLDEHGEHLRTISDSMSELAKAVVTLNNHNDRITNLETTVKEHGGRIGTLEKYKIKVVAFGTGAGAVLYMFAQLITKLFL